MARLRGTWEKLPTKYEKLFRDLQDIFDPSRNMAKYRNILNSQSLQLPIIPLFPVVKKDLTFLHEGTLMQNVPVHCYDYMLIDYQQAMFIVDYMRTLSEVEIRFFFSS